MTATVRLDDELTKRLEVLASTLQKKKSDVIRDAISFYAKNIESKKKTRLLKAVEKVNASDKKEYLEMEGTLADGI